LCICENTLIFPQIFCFQLKILIFKILQTEKFSPLQLLAPEKASAFRQSQNLVWTGYCIVGTVFIFPLKKRKEENRNFIKKQIRKTKKKTHAGGNYFTSPKIFIGSKKCSARSTLRGSVRRGKKIFFIGVAWCSACLFLSALYEVIHLFW